MPPIPPRNADDRLVRGIGRWALTAFAINLTVGAGILGLPARIQSLVGNFSIVVIILCGLLIALIALCFSEIGSRFDLSGGPQLYASEAFGPLGGFTIGWLLWISRLGTCAAVSNLLVNYGAVPYPPIVQPVFRAVAIGTLTLMYAWINIRGIRQTAAVSTAFTVSKLVPLIAFVAIGVFFVDPKSLHLGSPPPLTNLSSAIFLATFAFFGFDATSVLAGEVRDPQRSVPFAILVSVGCVLVLYTMTQVVCVGTLPNLASSERPLADAATLFVGPWGANAVSLAAVIACAGVFGASMTPATRLLFSMSDHGQLPAALARVNSRFHTPVFAILATTAAILILALSGSFIYLVKVTLIARVTVYATTCLVLPIFRRRDNLPKARFKVPAGLSVAYGCTVLCVLFLANSSIRELLDVALAVAIGLAIYGLSRIAAQRTH
jgi:APA family basic amino acid/polyamine antiporter